MAVSPSGRLTDGINVGGPGGPGAEGGSFLTQQSQGGGNVIQPPPEIPGDAGGKAPKSTALASQSTIARPPTPRPPAPLAPAPAPAPTAVAPAPAPAPAPTGPAPVSGQVQQVQSQMPILVQPGPGGATGLPGQPPPPGAFQPPPGSPGLTPNAPASPGGPPAVPLGGLGGLIERQLATPGRFDNPAVQQAFDALSGKLGTQGDVAANRAKVAGTSRGVFFGSGGIEQEERARDPFTQAQGDLATNLLLAQAQTGGQDQNAAIANAFRFGENQQSANQFTADLGLRSALGGFQGAPDINSAVSTIAGQPLPTGGGGAQFGGLGQLAGLLSGQAGGGGQPVPALPGATPGIAAPPLPQPNDVKRANTNIVF